jgi:isopenicillin N synthase-like dioxygenase
MPPEHRPASEASLPSSLPIIDLSPFLLPNSPSSSRLSTASAIHCAAAKYGFFFVTGLSSVVSPAEMEESLAVTRAFFDLPNEEKELLRIRKGDGARGWQRLGQNVTAYRCTWRGTIRGSCLTPHSLSPNHQPTITRATICVSTIGREIGAVVN